MRAAMTNESFPSNLRSYFRRFCSFETERMFSRKDHRGRMTREIRRKRALAELVFFKRLDRFGKDSARTSSKLVAFESKISEVDSYLQMIIEKVKTLESFAEGLKSSADKEKVEHLLEITNVLLDSFKHSIVLLQYAKNQIIPSKEALGTLHVRTIVEGADGQNKGVDSAAPAEKQDTVEMATEVLASSCGKGKGEATPEVSYSSSEDGDELYFDTVEQRTVSDDELGVSQDPAVPNEENIDKFPYVLDNEPEFSPPDYDFDCGANRNRTHPPERFLRKRFKINFKGFGQLYSGREVFEVTLLSAPLYSKRSFPSVLAAYDGEAEDELEDSREHGTIIVHLLSQLSVGMDLTKFTLPTYILERRSLLEMYADFMTFPDLFGKIADAPNPEERMIAVFRWYMSMFYGGRRSGLAKKPYNPLLGETFTCKWKAPESNSSQETASGDPSSGALQDEILFFGEQVSHHPPVSAFYVEYPSKQMQVNGQIWTKSKFLGLSIAVHNVGKTCLSVLKHDEEYVFDFPSAYGRSILTTPWVEFGGKCSIKCEKTGYSVFLEFQTKPFYNGKVHCIKAELYRPSEKTSFASVRGHWNGAMTIKTSNSEEVFLDVRRLDPAKKVCQRVLEQSSYESRRLWRHVTVALKEKDVHKATKCKFWLEQRQRDAAKVRAMKKINWEPTLFQKLDERWVYRTPLSKRLADKSS